MSGQRREFARISRFVECKKNQSQTWIIAIFVEQWLQITGVLRPDWDVGALIKPKMLGNRVVVVAQRAGMQLHRQAVVDAHTRHLH